MPQAAGRSQPIHLHYSVDGCFPFLVPFLKTRADKANSLYQLSEDPHSSWSLTLGEVPKIGGRQRASLGSRLEGAAGNPSFLDSCQVTVETGGAV